jgi:hypothetical protein
MSIGPDSSDAWIRPPVLSPLGRLVSRVMTEEPYRSARRVFLVLDNGSS